jgi:hypothetical protein|uniref:Four helix bundle protein n=1 Tax=candidate division CPR3 bacterium TaxID=2268181 RepID=A0A7V3N441_UNCC3
MKFKHENLEVYQLAMELVQIVYKLLKKFPKKKMYKLIALDKSLKARTNVQ